jgi:hypothetical protein
MLRQNIEQLPGRTDLPFLRVSIKVADAELAIQQSSAAAAIESPRGQDIVFEV